jgi:hypothetical protein
MAGISVFYEEYCRRRFPVLALSFAPRCAVSEPSPITYSPRNPAGRLAKELHWGGGNPPPHRLPCFSHS